MIKVDIQEINVRKNGTVTELLRDIYFILEPGCIYSIMGKNGAGKTTLLKSLTNLLDERFFDVRGEVFFKGTNLISLSDEHLISLRRKYAKYIFQDPASSFNPLKTFKYYFDNFEINEGKLRQYLDILSLPPMEKLSRLFPYEVSGGMIQRLALALTLAANPMFLLLDEPNSGIDYALSNVIADSLKDFVTKTNSIALIVTQDISFAESISDKLGILYNGTFSGFYNPKEILDKTDLNEDLNNFVSAYKSL
jgi:ABC-type glutathione transport system ATPase component